MPHDPPFSDDESQQNDWIEEQTIPHPDIRYGYGPVWWGGHFAALIVAYVATMVPMMLLQGQEVVLVAVFPELMLVLLVGVWILEGMFLTEVVDRSNASIRGLAIGAGLYTGLFPGMVVILDVPRIAPVLFGVDIILAGAVVTVVAARLRLKRLAGHWIPEIAIGLSFIALGGLLGTWR